MSSEGLVGKSCRRWRQKCSLFPAWAANLVKAVLDRASEIRERTGREVEKEVERLSRRCCGRLRNHGWQDRVDPYADLLERYQGVSAATG